MERLTRFVLRHRAAGPHGVARGLPRLRLRVVAAFRAPHEPLHAPGHGHAPRRSHSRGALRAALDGLLHPRRTQRRECGRARPTGSRGRGACGRRASDGACGLRGGPHRRRRRRADRVEPHARGFEGDDGCDAPRGRPDRGAEVLLTGQAAIEHDLDPVFAEDLLRGEMIAIPIAFLILVFTFGTLAFLLPFAFAILTIPTTLGLIWIFANFMELTTYLTNLVTLIGLGIAIDYSLLVVYRFREELRRGSPPRRGDRHDDAHRGTRRGLQRRRGGDRARAPSLHAASVHPGVRPRRLAHPGRLGRGGGDVPPGAALAGRSPARPRPTPAEELDRAPRRPRARVLGCARALHHAVPEARRRDHRDVSGAAHSARCSPSSSGPARTRGFRATSRPCAATTC